MELSPNRGSAATRLTKAFLTPKKEHKKIQDFMIIGLILDKLGCDWRGSCEVCRPVGGDLCGALADRGDI